ARSLGPTLAYAVPGFVLATTSALLGGFAAARWRGWPGRALLATSTVLMSTSSVIIVVLGQYLLAHRLRVFPVLGWPLAGDARELAGFVILPALLWAVIQLGPDLRHYRAVFVRELAAPHLEGLRARGLGEVRIARHVLRGAVAPVLARISARLPQIVLGSVVVEHVFNVPGVGALLIAAIQDGDLAVVQGIAFCLAAATIVGQALCDVAVYFLDPRTRARAEAGR
ncbi:MAG TPA: ABC transporter permease, partial [Nannocystis sp.]